MESVTWAGWAQPAKQHAQGPGHRYGPPQGKLLHLPPCGPNHLLPLMTGRAGGSVSSGDGVSALTVFNKSLFGKGSFLIGGKCHCPWSSSASDLASACSHRLLPPVQSPVLLGFSLHIQRFLLSLPHSPMCDPSLSLISLPVHPCPAP